MTKIWAVLLFLVPALSMVGCASTKYKWAKMNTTQEEFNRDGAQCKLVAMNVYNKTTYTNPTPTTYTTYGSYNKATGSYTSRKVQNNNYFEDLNRTLTKSSAESKAYRLCMQGKGYKRVEAVTKKAIKHTPDSYYRYIPGRYKDIGNSCESSFDCSGRCYEGRCISTEKWFKVQYGM